MRVATVVPIAVMCGGIALAMGCGAKAVDGMAGTGGGGGTAGSANGGGSGGAPPTRAVDVLFLVDDSSSMRLSQMKLERDFLAFVNTLKALPDGLPDMHIAVISSDMGAGAGDISGCAGTGKGGIFQNTPRGSCTATNLQPGATFITHAGGVANYTGDLADVLSCIALLGESGCGYERQLTAIARALGADGQQPPTENQGFLRPDAALFIVLVTNEDDCSAPAGSQFYDAMNNNSLASPLGPSISFRCSEFGHLCNGSKPPRLAPNGSVTDIVMLTGCVPAEASGMLTPVASFVQQVRALKRFPDSQIVVAAVTGPSTPYGITWVTSNSFADTGPWPWMMHSCTAADSSFADPAVRISAFVNAFGTNGLLYNICDDSYAPALQFIAERIGDAVSR